MDAETEFPNPLQKTDEFQESNFKEELQKEIERLKNIIKNVKEQLEILENRTDRTGDYTVRLLQRIMEVIDKRREENVIKKWFRKLKNTCVWAFDSIYDSYQMRDYRVNDEMFNDIVNNRDFNDDLETDDNRYYHDDGI